MTVENSLHQNEFHSHGWFMHPFQVNFIGIYRHALVEIMIYIIFVFSRYSSLSYAVGQKNPQHEIRGRSIKKGPVPTVQINQKRFCMDAVSKNKTYFSATAH